jgi:hypothetical protein
MAPGGSASSQVQPGPVTTAASGTTDVDKETDPPDGQKKPEEQKKNVGPSR